jgi:hypothetical protein
MTVGYDQATSQLTVGNGSQVASVALLGSYMASAFATASDGDGGTFVTQQGANTMNLIAPPHA